MSANGKDFFFLFEYLAPRELVEQTGTPFVLYSSLCAKTHEKGYDGVHEVFLSVDRRAADAAADDLNISSFMFLFLGNSNESKFKINT